MENKLKQAIILFNEILEWNYSFDNQDEIKPELRDKIESFINECAIFDVSNNEVSVCDCEFPLYGYKNGECWCGSCDKLIDEEN